LEVEHRERREKLIRPRKRWAEGIKQLAGETGLRRRRTDTVEKTMKAFIHK